MADDRVAALLDHAADLERRDEVVARELETVEGLADRAGAVRARADEVRAELERIPVELEELERRAQAAARESDEAREELRLADERLERLERGRRSKREETDRARREAETARQRLADVESDVERLDQRGRQLRLAERELHVEARELTRSAATIALDLRRVPRVTEDAGREPETLAGVEDWGQLVRSALFVVRGTLEAERERIVTEANALGESALGETLGATSVALVRRRLERELA
jgi:chromosome segregation ATPase